MRKSQKCTLPAKICRKKQWHTAKKLLKGLELENYLDENAYLTSEYRFENGIGKDGDITDPDLNILVEMATQEEMEEILEKSQVKLSDEDDRSLAARGFTSGQSVGVTQKPRVSVQETDTLKFPAQIATAIVQKTKNRFGK